MKKGIFICVIAAAGSAIFSSCNNGNYDANPATNLSNVPVPAGTGGGSTSGGGSGGNSSFNWTGTDPFSAQVDGATFATNSANASVFNGYVDVTGLTATGESISMHFPDNTAVNATVTLSDGSNYFSYGTSSDTYTGATNRPGAVKVLENDASHIKGKFYGTLQNISNTKTVTITNGYFNVTK